MLLPVQTFASNEINLSLQNGQDIILYVESLKLQLKDIKEDLNNTHFKLGNLFKRFEQQEKLFKIDLRKITELDKQLIVYENLYNLELEAHDNTKKELTLTKKNNIIDSFSKNVMALTIGITVGVTLGIFLL